jgi:adenine-specific DNA methylase
MILHIDKRCHLCGGRITRTRYYLYGVQIAQCYKSAEHLFVVSKSNWRKLFSDLVDVNLLSYKSLTHHFAIEGGTILIDYKPRCEFKEELIHFLNMNSTIGKANSITEISNFIDSAMQSGLFL